jgi:hypothetical protein
MNRAGSDQSRRLPVLELIVALGIVMLSLAVVVVGLAMWRIGQVVSWRALAMTAWATGSVAACVAFVRFCAEEERQLHGVGLEKPKRDIMMLPKPNPVLEEVPRAS